MKKLNLLTMLCISTTILMGGCSTTTKPTYASANPPATYTGSSDIQVNGQVPTEKVGAVKNRIFETTDSNGVTRIVGEVTRKPGYRSMVHYMTYTVTSCVIKGEATLVLEGSAPQTYKAGECYAMPAGVKGYVANDGKTVLKLLDYNTVPAGQATSVMLEK